MYDWIGWLATLTFTASYICRKPNVLRRVQALAGVLWLIYGTLIHSVPIIVANVIMTVVAFASSFNLRFNGPRAGTGSACPDPHTDPSR